MSKMQQRLYRRSCCVSFPACTVLLLTVVVCVHRLLMGRVQEEGERE